MTARIKISELPPASTLTGAEQLPVVQGGETRRTTVGDFASLVPAPLLSVGAERVSDFALAVADADYIPVASAGTVAVTVPANATEPFPIGSQITLERRGAGALTIAAAGGVTVTAPAQTVLSARAQGSKVTLIKVASDRWEAAGDLTPDALTAAQVSDFTEASQDVIGAMVVAAGGTYDDDAGTVVFPRDRVTRCVRTTTLSTTNGAWALVPWDAEDFDDANAHSNSVNNSRVISPADATRWRITAGAVWASNSTGARLISIELNGGGTAGAGTFLGADYRTAINETVGHADTGWRTIDTPGTDYVEVFVLQTSGGARNLLNSAGTFLQVEFR
jgi:hypothetical protein